MPWFPVDDAFHSHPKARKAGLEAIGLWTVCGSYCMAYLTDGFVPDWLVREKPRGIALAKKLVSAGLWDVTEHEGENGWRFHEWKADCTKASVLADRRASAARQEVARNPQLRNAIRKRDGDICRYCATPVEWHNRRGQTGGTYDHVDPAGGSTIGNLVVCCRGCNSRKGRRTPTQAGMRLRPIGPDGGPDGSRSDLDRESEISRSVLSPLHSTPLHSNSLVDSGGEVTDVDAGEAPPQCSKHPENSDTPCHFCRKRREWEKEHEGDQLIEKRRRRDATTAARQAAIDACKRCDEFGDITFDDCVAKCNHGEAANA